jgi:hypothetical protein
MSAKIYKPGQRLKSAVCETQIIILRAPSEPIELQCGGAEVLAFDAPSPADAKLDPAFAEPSLTGKRYVDEGETLEFLCTKGGAGGLSVNGTALAVKQAKKLPSSD